MVVVNVPGGAGGTFPEVHPVTSLHLDVAAYNTLVAYGATPGATATIGGYTISLGASPSVASFSSRGPLSNTLADLLKPVSVVCVAVYRL